MNRAMQPRRTARPLAPLVLSIDIQNRPDAVGLRLSPHAPVANRCQTLANRFLFQLKK